jgi:hypothetical protein
MIALPAPLDLLQRERGHEIALIQAVTLFAPQLITVLRGHGFPAVYSAAFSPDGSRIVTASEDKTARIWDVATGKEITVLRGHDRKVNSASFSTDGSRIITASDDTTARVWHVEAMSAKRLLAEACARLAGDMKLTREEMRLVGYPDSMPEIDVCKG